MNNKQLFDNMASELIAGKPGEARKLADNLTRKQCLYIIDKCEKAIDGFDMGEMLDFADEIRTLQSLAKSRIKSFMSLVEYINTFYTSSLAYKNGMNINIISPLSNELNTINTEQFNSMGILKELPNTCLYILYSNTHN